MKALKKIIRSLRVEGLADTEFESYYGKLLRNTGNGGPSAAEARRDFARVRHTMDRATYY